ncbi:MAG: serine hydroxymethyltransferase [Candidatus Altiarchaeales archaeon ex4484_2]|nr:MAG: serine hydroxymethyltransferase [Candidatus Altiarchaeales archaeon ex4484_2]
MNYYQEAFNLISKQHQWRGSCLNMIASENITSPAVREAIASDFGHRYAEGVAGGVDENTRLKVFDRYYQGTKYFDRIEALAIKLSEELFHAEHANVVPISGVVANLVAYHALSKRGDRITALGLLDGGHISHCKISAAGVMGLKDIPYAFNEKEMNIDVDESKKIVRKEKPSIMLFGASVYLFPHPVNEMVDVAREINAKIVYDGAHVAGLIAGGRFHDPLKEGADVVTASTHKTLPGPQGGIILCKKELAEKIDNTAFPALMSNHHLHHVAGLLVALAEMKEYGSEYAGQIISNAKALAQSMHEHGIHVLCEHKNFTESHQILVDVSDHGGGAEIADRCEEANIILNKNLLPWDTFRDTRNPSGLRIGVQELTRLGMKESEMKDISMYLKQLIIDRENPGKVREEVEELKKEFNRVHYAFPSQRQAYEQIKFK